MFKKLQLKPGINRDQTNYSGEGGWWQCDKIRFRSGYPEKVGGWIKASPSSFIGVCRQMWGWITSYNDDLLALGTNSKVYVEAGSNFYDITPLSGTFISPDTDNCFRTGFVGNGSITGAVLTVTTATYGHLVIGAEITGSGIAANTTITAYGTGSGGVGTYTVTPTQTVGSVAITGLSTTVTVTIVANGSVLGDYVTFSGATTVGGVPAGELNIEHEITEILSSSEFTIVVDTVATSSAAGGGTGITAEFQINVGYVVRTAGYGYGAGAWERGGWGSGAAVPVFFAQRDWWFDNFDNDLVMNIRNGAIYYWERGTDPEPEYTTRAVLLSSLGGANAVPDIAMQVTLSQQDRHLLAFGCTPFGGGTADPLLIRWSDQNDPVEWEPMVTNSAGFLRVSRGSRIVRALATRQEVLVWTDSNLYTLQFLGTSDVFGVQEYADNISIISARAVISASNVTYWMGQDKFYAYSGRVETLPCTLRNHVFQNLNYNQAPQIICGTNEGFHEVWWFYPSADSDINDSYVIYNYLEQIWYYGTIERTAWNDSPLRTYPQAAEYDSDLGISYLYSHENGVDDGVVGMEAYIQSNDIDIDDGDKFMLTKRIIPDVNFTGSDRTANPTPTAVLTILPRSFPGAPYTEEASDAQQVISTAVDEYTNQVFIRARARQMALKISSTDIGVKWQMGSPRIDARPSGRR